MVATITEFQRGKLDVITGSAHFKVRFKSIVFKPYKNEVLMAEVSQATEQGFFCNAGPLEMLVSTHHIPSDYLFNPADKEYVKDDEQKMIKKGSHCRVRIIGMTVDTDKIVAVATMLGPYLGVTN
eukprot:CAMPEP_0184478198 /NCGR_PEP_ID=MMETSP0113_2-20130426/288_1 /TAXON_ID=91329 /ORGANISM="Norrisiella sphaerica, Strain BC52" /LENGTH=124 /DNA_ID=CAMNT_0026855897 /DNA_START=186 /DNA_END=560 /DNA_ORIENTATION=+